MTERSLWHDAAKSEPDTRKSRRWVDWLRPCEVALRLPWGNRHRPYVAVNVYRQGHNLLGGRSREIKVVLLMWGRMFTDYRTYPAKRCRRARAPVQRTRSLGLHRGDRGGRPCRESPA